MNEDEILTSVAKTLHWGYVRDTTGTPGHWGELTTEEKKLWRGMARRAVKRLDLLRAEAAAIA